MNPPFLKPIGEEEVMRLRVLGLQLPQPEITCQFLRDVIDFRLTGTNVQMPALLTMDNNLGKHSHSPSDEAIRVYFNGILARIAFQCRSTLGAEMLLFPNHNNRIPDHIGISYTVLRAYRKTSDARRLACKPHYDLLIRAQ